MNKRTSFTRLACLAAAVVCCMFPQVAKADDGGSWINLQMNKSWQKSYGFIRLEHRSNHNFSDTEAKFLAAGLGLKMTPWLKTDLSYECWDVNPDYLIHKAVLTSTGTLSRDGLAVSVREKLEFTTNSNSFTLRSRLRGQYSIPGTSITPYAQAEVFNWKDWVRSLYYVGSEFRFGSNSMVDIFYLYHLPNGAEPVHVLGLGYYFNF